MSENINQIYTANPATSMMGTDLYYLGRSPYGSTNDMAITWTNVMSSITTVGTVTSGTWNASLIGATYGGTGVNNGSSTFTMGGNVTFSGSYTFTGTLSANTSVTFPTSGTLLNNTLTSANIYVGNGSNVATGVAMSGDATITNTGSVSVTGISHVTSGTLALANGGTNANLTASNGGIVYSTASALGILSGTSTANQVLLSGSSTTPAWSTATYPATTTASQLLYSSSANTVTGLTTANNGMLVTNNSGVPSISTLTAGQIFIGTTSAAPTAATLSNGTGISITSASGAITINATGGGVSWTNVSGTSQSAAVNNGYIANNSSLVTITLPSTVALGSVIQVAGLGSGGWKIAQNASQQIHFGSSATTSGTGGSLASSNQYDCVTLLCVTANTTFVVTASQGNLTVV